MWDAIKQVFLLTIKLNNYHLLPLNYFLRLAFLLFLLFHVDLFFVREPLGYVAFCTFPLQHLGHQLQPFLGEKPCKEELGWVSNPQRVKFTKMLVSWYSANDIRVIVVVVRQPWL